MTDKTENTGGESGSEDGAKKRVLKARPGRLELKKTVGAGQVRQNFSHGRSKTVTVEVRRKRTFAKDSGGSMVEAKASQAPDGGKALPQMPAPDSEGGSSPRRAVLKTLTEEEAAARAKALQGARNTDSEAAQIVERSAMGAEARRAATREDAEKKAEEEQRREDESQRRRDEEERRHRDEEEVARKALEQAERLEAKTDASAPGESDGAAAGRGQRRGEAESEDDEKGAHRPGRATPRRPGARRGEPRRRTGKLTISQALNDEERVRSLASVRRAREREKRALSQPAEAVKVLHEVVIPETISVQELSNRMAERGVDVIKSLMKMGVMANMQQTIDADTAELVVAEFGHTPKRVSESDVEIGLKGPEDSEDTLRPRPPVVTVMGHVDHGKTSLLDALRATDIAGGEAGGITQHIGAYQVQLASGGRITFIDTPGHAAFTSMRARGANVTDVVVLVVAADDGIMPQTVEAIAHAKAAEVPIIVAINKMDKPDADPTRVRNELLQHELVVEEMGGDVLSVEVSALQKTNLDKLEEGILLQAELLELRANPARPAEGVVVEANLDSGRGAIATVLVQHGTLKIADIVVAGSQWGRVRSLLDDTGNSIEEAGPGTPVEVQGLSAPPVAGDDFAVVETEARAREVSEYRERTARTARTTAVQKGSLEEIFDNISSGETKELPVVIKADTHGSAEAIASNLEEMGDDEVKVQLLHSGVGGINESDITLAAASKALVLGFNVRANVQARELSKETGVDIRYYSVIYNLTDDIKDMLSGMLAPESRETFLGNAEILEVFNISKQGKVAGCKVTDGAVKRGASVRLLRDDVVIHEGKLSTLKRFKDEVREVHGGTECGMAFENYQDLKVGDVIECFEVEQIARSL